MSSKPGDCGDPMCLGCRAIRGSATSADVERLYAVTIESIDARLRIHETDMAQFQVMVATNAKTLPHLKAAAPKLYAAIAIMQSLAHDELKCAADLVKRYRAQLAEEIGRNLTEKEPSR